MKTEYIEFQTDGLTHIIDLTPNINDLLHKSGFVEGNVLISGIGSTTGITTVEFEPGLVHSDISEMFDHFAPYGKTTNTIEHGEMTTEQLI